MRKTSIYSQAKKPLLASVLYGLAMVMLTAHAMLQTTTAQAAGLGKMRVMSELGAPFRAEIEMLNLKPEEQNDLTVRLASPELFRQAGIDYNPALGLIRAVYSKDAPNSIQLSSSSPINEPLLELLVETSWPSGRLVRQYTVLLDPPSGSTDKQETQDQSPAPVTAQRMPEIFVPPPSATSPNSLNNTQPNAGASNANQGQRGNSASAPSNYEVRSGDTLYTIASRLSNGDERQIKQLMAQLLQNNPHAFIGNNINRLKSGVVLSTNGSPADSSAASASLTPSTVRPTARSFSQYKQAAQQNVKPLGSKTASKKSVSSQVSAAKKAETTIQTSDQLKVAGEATLAKNATASSNSKSEDKLAKEKQLAEEKSRLAELQNNIKKTLDIKNSALAQATTPNNTAGSSAANKSNPSPAVTSATGAAASAASGALAVGAGNASKAPTAAPNATSSPVSTPTPTSPTPPATPALPAAVTPPSAASTPQTGVKSSDKAPATTTNAPTTAPPIAQTEWYEDIDPLTLGGGAGVLALLGGWMVYRRKRNQETDNFSDTEFSPRDTQGSLLTVDGGQAVDTFNSVFASNFADTGSAMESAEVDPVAEAEVYIQYGRDAHAEDILKDALKRNPNRHPVRIKLMELYAKQQNTQGLTQQYSEMSELTQQTGSDWILAKKIVDGSTTQLGDLSKSTKLKGQGGSSGLSSAEILMGSSAGGNTSPRFNLSEPTMIGEVLTPKASMARGGGVLDPSTGITMPITLETGITSPTQMISRPGSPAKLPVLNQGLNFDIAAPSQIFPPNLGTNLEVDTFAPLNIPTATGKKSGNDLAASPDSLLEFKLTKLDRPVDTVLGGLNTNTSFAPTNTMQSMETKLSLAQAYLDIGDKVGAKELLQEVLDSGHQTLVQQASALMSKV